MKFVLKSAAALLIILVLGLIAIYARYGAGLAVIAYGDVPRGESLVATALERDAKAGDQLNELGFMGYVGERLATRMGGLDWPVLYVALVALYVVLHYFFVSQTSQMLALLAVFLDVGIRGGVPAALMAPGLLFASSYFSVITPQGGSQNIIFVAS